MIWKGKRSAWIGHGKSAPKTLTQHPGPGLFRKTESAMAKGRGLRGRMDELSLAHVFRGAVRKIHFHDRVDRQLDGAATKKAIETDVLGGRIQFDVITAGVRAAEFERNTQTHADF